MHLKLTADGRIGKPNSMQRQEMQEIVGRKMGGRKMGTQQLPFTHAGARYALLPL